MRYYSLQTSLLLDVMPLPELDNADLRILRILQSEGRISNLDLAERIGLSPTPCSRRLKRLEKSGVIAGYGARLNPDALGLGISAHHSPR